MQDDIAPLGDFPGQLLRALRQGVYFGVQTRIPYAITAIVRPYLFGGKVRPLAGSIKFFAAQALQHGWVIARISFLYKLSEKLLAILSRSPRPLQWHSFVAGGLAGYLVMVRDTSHAKLKKQINMAIGIRTIYAIASYAVRKGYCSSVFQHSTAGYERGTAAWYTILWAVVMWHWRHQTQQAPGEMNPSQVAQMNFIYNAGDDPDLRKWFTSNFPLWVTALAVAKNYL